MKFLGARYHLNPYAYAEHTRKFLRRILNARISAHFFCMAKLNKNVFLKLG
jgi:hypothetical protein